MSRGVVRSNRPVTELVTHKYSVAVLITNFPVEDCSKEQIEQINKIVKETAELAKAGTQHFDGSATPWTNYFRLQEDNKGFASDQKQAHAAWHVAAEIDSHSRRWQFRFVCLKESHKSCKTGSVAIADGNKDELIHHRQNTSPKSSRPGRPDSSGSSPKPKKGSSSDQSMSSRPGSPSKKLQKRGPKKAKKKGKANAKDGDAEAQRGESSSGAGVAASGHSSQTGLAHRPQDPSSDQTTGQSTDNKRKKNKGRPNSSSSSANSEEDRLKKKGKHSGGPPSGPSMEEAEKYKTISLCPKFFKLPTTAGLGLDLEKPKTSGPRASRKNKSLCDKYTLFSKLENSAESLLHEVTHLDWFGYVAGWSVFHDKARGTDDFDRESRKDYITTARALARSWQEHNAKDKKWPPWRNAENIAASAFEFWFLKKCGLDEQEPKYSIPLSAEDVTRQQEKDAQIQNPDDSKKKKKKGSHIPDVGSSRQT